MFRICGKSSASAPPVFVALSRSILHLMLSVMVEDLTVRPDDDDAVVKGGATDRAIALVDPDDHGDPRLARCRSYPAKVVVSQIDGIFQKTLVNLLAQGPVAARTKPPNPGRIAGYEGLRKDDQLCTPGGCFGHEPHRLFERCLSVGRLLEVSV